MQKIASQITAERVKAKAFTSETGSKAAKARWDKKGSKEEDTGMRPASRDYILQSYGLAIKPLYDGVGNKLGRIVLYKVAGLRNGEQGPVVFQPFPGVIQAAG
jgi:hypothetical protein